MHEDLINAGVMPVHVVNPEDMRPVTVEEHEPEHFVIRTVVLGPFSGNQPGQIGNWYQQIANLDLRRESIAIYNPDGPMVLCHSEAQASSNTNLTANVPIPEGGFFAQGSAVSLDGTGPLWAVNPGAGTIRIVTVSNRRGAA